MNSDEHGLRVLAITRDRAFLRALRLEMPLFNLRRQGLIQDYFITDPSLFDVPDDFLFNVVWLQRCNYTKLRDLLERKIGDNFMYDVDDLLIGEASYREDRLSYKDVIRDFIKKCRVLVVTSIRLGRLLERYVGVPLSDKIVVCPNALEFPAGLKPPAPPKGMLLTSSGAMALVESQAEILSAIAHFSEQHHLPIHYFGPKNRLIESYFPTMSAFGLVGFWQYHTILTSLPPMIGLAPLETQADEATIDFINGKSDIKMLDFGGLGHPGVYSKAAPYVDTDIHTGLVVDNRAEDWRAALEEIYSHLWKSLDAEQAEIMKSRNMDRVAEGHWLEALRKSRLPNLLTGRDIRFSSRPIYFFINAAKHMVFSQDNIFLKRLQERIPAPLMRALRRTILDN
ncbi:MAG: hypothetical protein ACLQPD_29815 [Desulfomonilaceae bacterium]